jgi:proline dehydrogenase
MNLLYPLAKRFIAGHDFESAKPQINKLMEEGYEVSIDYLGELSRTEEDCEKAKDQYIQIIKHFRHKKIDISIKPSQLGLLLAPVICNKHLNQIAICAKVCGHTIRLDMEDSRVTELTRNIAISLNKRHGNVGVALQANLHRTPQDLKILIDKKISVRLVKGAYPETSKIALQNKRDIEEVFFQYAADLIKKGHRPAIGTHDEQIIEDIVEMLPEPNRFDYEFLYGIRRDLQRGMKEDNYNVRIYVPFGEDWLPYILRRLKEWKNLKFIIRNVVKEWWR